MRLFIKNVRKKLNTYIHAKRGVNKGFSLIEVLVAIVVLAIITLPILSSFATSAKVNSNARRQENANSLAQKVMEEFKSLSIQQLTNGYIDGPLDVKHEVNESATGVVNCTISQPANVPLKTYQYLFDMATYGSTGPKGGIITPYCEGVNGEKFVVKVTLDPSSYADKSGVVDPTADNKSNNINSYDMPSFSDVNIDSNYVIMQQMTQHDLGVLRQLDATAGLVESDVRKEVTIDAIVTQTGTVNLITGKDPSGFDLWSNVQTYDQTLKLNVKYIVTKAGPAFGKTAEYNYEYHTKIIDDSSKINQLNSLTGENAYSDFKNIYLFYSAFDKYKASIATTEDKININYFYPLELSSHKFNVFVVEQDIDNVNPANAGLADKKIHLEKNNITVKVNGNTVSLPIYGTLKLDGIINTAGPVNIYSNMKNWNQFISGNQKNNITQNTVQSITKYLYNIKVEIWVNEAVGVPFLTITSTKEN